MARNALERAIVLLQENPNRGRPSINDAELAETLESLGDVRVGLDTKTSAANRYKSAIEIYENLKNESGVQRLRQKLDDIGKEDE